MSAAFRFAALLLLVSAAPAGAALSDERALACNQIRNDAGIFVGEIGDAFAFRPYQAEIETARTAWLAAKAESDRSPNDIQSLMKTLDAHTELEHLEDLYPDVGELMVTPVTVERTFRGTQAATNFVVLPKNAKVQRRRLYLFYGRNDRFPFYENLYTVQLPPNEVSRAHLELQILEAAASSELGMVAGVLDHEDASDHTRVTPLAGFMLRLTGEGYVENVVTDAEGIFIATNVPPGAVTVTPLLSGGLLSNQSASTVTVTPGACQTIGLRVVLNGRIRIQN